jgi:hypothetical protein
MELFLILLGATIIFFAISLHYIPADPPHIAVVTFLGQRLRKIKREGYRLFPFYPVICNAVLIEMTKQNQDLSAQIVRTRDLAELEVSVSLTWTPSEDYAIEFLNNGGQNGVRNILQDMVRERLREWANSHDWITILGAHDESTTMIIRDVAGLSSYLSKEQQETMIRRLRFGDGVQPIPQIGITLNRLNIGEIKPKGELAHAAERMVTKLEQIKGVKVELDYVVKTANEITKVLGCSAQEAIELLQIERGKVPKRINEMRLSVSDEMVKMVEQIIDLWGKKKK